MEETKQYSVGVSHPDKFKWRLWLRSDNEELRQYFW